MRFFARAHGRRLTASVALVACLAAADGFAIEMFTYFGDGSRIGLPSLEVPIEAYPGIPLRSDRLRARRRAMRMGPGSTIPAGPAAAGGITIRSMPTAQPAVAIPTRPALPAVVTDEGHREPRAVAEPAAEPLVAPEPEDEAPPAPISSPSGS